MITKGEIVKGAFDLLKISGVTTQPTGDELAIGVQVCDDVFAQLSIDLDTGYYLPVEYGTSTGGDDSGLVQEFAGPCKKVLAMELFTAFMDGDVPPALQRTHRMGMNALEQAIVVVKPTCYPSTLPIGSGNDYLETDATFYPGATPANTVDAVKGDSISLAYDWSSWTTGDDSVSTVTYSATSGVEISATSIEDDISYATVTFTSEGFKSICIKATSVGGAVKTVKRNYWVSDCEV